MRSARFREGDQVDATSSNHTDTVFTLGQGGNTSDRPAAALADRTSEIDDTRNGDFASVAMQRTPGAKYLEINRRRPERKLVDLCVLRTAR